MQQTRASDLAAAKWRKSSLSGVGECVEIAELDGCVAVRNSNSPGIGTLIFTVETMAAWIAGIRAGEFDELAG